MKLMEEVRFKMQQVLLVKLLHTSVNNYSHDVLRTIVINRITTLSLTKTIV